MMFQVYLHSNMATTKTSVTVGRYFPSHLGNNIVFVGFYVLVHI